MRQRFADDGSGTGQDIHDPIGDTCFEADFTQQNGGERRDTGRFQHHGVAGSECRRDLPGRHQQRKVPRNDLGTNSIRLAEGVIEQRTVHRNLIAPELGREIAVVLEAVGRSGHVRRATRR